MSDTFATLFESQATLDGPGRNLHKAIRLGQAIEVVVIQIGNEHVFVEFDGKRQAYFDTAELLDSQGVVAVKVGDKLLAKVVDLDLKSGVMRLGRSMGKVVFDLHTIEQAKKAGIPIEGKVTGVNKGGLEIDLGKQLKAFCPLSQIATRFVQNASEMIGQTLLFKVTDIRGERQVVVSRRAVLEEEAKESLALALSALEIGKKVEGVVTAIREFGAFVDVGGIEALLPSRELGYERRAVADVLRVGETIQAVVLDIKHDEKGKPRVSLSLKELSSQADQLRTEGDMSGESQSHRVAGNDRKARNLISGQGPEVGTIVSGSVVRVENYGVFLQLDELKGSGYSVRGLVPVSELGAPRGADLRKAFPEGTKLSARVMAGSTSGKLRLSIREAKEEMERADYESHRESANSQKTLGTFADLLKTQKFRF